MYDKENNVERRNSCAFFHLLLSFHMVRDMISHGCIWLFPHSLPRLLLSDGKPVLDLQLCRCNEGKGDRREDFTSTVWRLGWDKTKGKAFLGSQIADSGRWDLPCTQPSINYALTGTLIPKVHFCSRAEVWIFSWLQFTSYTSCLVQPHLSGLREVTWIHL